MDRYCIINIDEHSNLVANIPEPIIETETQTQTLIDLDNDEEETLFHEVVTAMQREVYDLTQY